MTKSQRELNKIRKAAQAKNNKKKHDRIVKKAKNEIEIEEDVYQF